MIHADNWRDPDSGYHTNDVESENHRMKMWLRQRYSKLRLNRMSEEGNESELDSVCVYDVYEYCHYVNVGKSMEAVMQSVRVASGLRQKRQLVF